VDRVGTLYALDADNGKLLQTMYLGGLGSTGVSIGADKKGSMMLLVTSGGSGSDKVTPGTYGFRLQRSSERNSIIRTYYASADPD